MDARRAQDEYVVALALMYQVHAKFHSWWNQVGNRPGIDAPYFFAVHAYFDLLMERWMKRHSDREAPCAEAIACFDEVRDNKNALQLFPDFDDQPDDARPDDCVDRVFQLQMKLSGRELCDQPSERFGFEYDVLRADSMQ